MASTSSRAAQPELLFVLKLLERSGAEGQHSALSSTSELSNSSATTRTQRHGRSANASARSVAVPASRAGSCSPRRRGARNVPDVGVWYVDADCSDASETRPGLRRWGMG